MIKFTQFVISIGSVLLVGSTRHCSFNTNYSTYILILCFLDSQYLSPI